MRELLAARRRAEEFSSILDGGTAPVDPSLEAPLRAVGMLRELPPIAPSADFETDLRAQLVAEVEAALRPAVVEVSGRPARERRRLTVAASALVIVGAGTGVATASQQALPGDLLYPVKRSIESVQLQIATGDFSKGSQYLDQASTRLDEVTELATLADSEHTTTEINTAFQDFSYQAQTGARLLIGVYRSGGDVGALTTVRTFTTSAARQLNTLTGILPVAAQESSLSAASTVVSLDSVAVNACPGCTDTLPTVYPATGSGPVALPGAPATTTSPSATPGTTTSPSQSPSGAPTTPPAADPTSLPTQTAPPDGTPPGLPTPTDTANVPVAPPGAPTVAPTATPTSATTTPSVPTPSLPTSPSPPPITLTTVSPPSTAPPPTTVTIPTPTVTVTTVPTPTITTTTLSPPTTPAPTASPATTGSPDLTPSPTTSPATTPLTATETASTPDVTIPASDLLGPVGQ